MKIVRISLLLFGFLALEASGQSSSLRDFETLKEQRDKALETATRPIQEKFIAALEALLQRTIKSGDVDAAAKMKAELEVAQGVLSPSFVIGVWKQISPDGRQSVYVIEPEGKAFFLSSDGRSFPNVWKIEGRKLIVGPPDDRDGRYTLNFTVDGSTLKGEGARGEKGFVATKAP